MGYFADTLIFGATKLISDSSYSVFVAKYDPSGNFIWARQSRLLNYTSSPYFVCGNSIAIDRFDNIYITGYFGDTISFGAEVLKGGLSSANVFVVKYSKSGNVLWAKSAIATSMGYAQSNSIAVDIVGNVFITGTFADTVLFDVNSLITKCSQDVFIAKYDSLGNVLWVEKANGNTTATVGVGCSISVDMSGDSYVTGYFTDTIAFGSATLIEPNSNEEVFLAKYNGNNGNVLWAIKGNNFGNDPQWVGYSVACDTIKSGGGYMVIQGEAPSPWIYSLGFGNDTFNLTANYPSATIFLKFDSSGNVLSGNIFTEGFEDDGDGVGVSPSGQYVYLGGDLADLTIFGPDTLPYGNDVPFLARWGDSEATGIKEPKPNETIAVYPNPFHKSTSIVVNSVGKYYLEVDDITGRKLEFIKFTGKQYELSSQGLASGMYFVRVFDETNTLVGTSKIVVQ